MARIVCALGIAFALLLTMPLRAAEPTRTPRASVAEGTWGGVGIAMTVGPSGAKLDLDCAHGSIDEPLALDAAGRFDLKGTWVQERPGPVRMGGEAETGKPARYAGTLDGESLTLRIRVSGPGREIGPLTATRGGRVKVRKCL